MKLKGLLFPVFIFSLAFLFAESGNGNNSGSSGNVGKIANSGNRGRPYEKRTLVIASPHPLALINPIIENFENEYNIDVELVQGGTGEIIANLRRYPDSVPYDVLWGGSYTTVFPFSTFFEDYHSKNEPFISEAYKNTEGMFTRFSNVPSVLMINKKRLGEIKVEGYADLLNPLLRGQIAFADPETSSSSWEHLINMLFAMGNGKPENGWNYVHLLCKNIDGKLQSGSSAVYDGVAKGQFAVGLTFEEGAANYAENDDNILIVYMKEGVVFTPDGICLLKNARNPGNAKLFIDYATDLPVQNYISRQLNRRSVRSDVEIKKLFLSESEIHSISADYSYAVEKQKQWWAEFHNYMNDAGQR